MLENACHICYYQLYLSNTVIIILPTLAQSHLQWNKITDTFLKNFSKYSFHFGIGWVFSTITWCGWLITAAWSYQSVWNKKNFFSITFIFLTISVVCLQRKYGNTTWAFRWNSRLFSLESPLHGHGIRPWQQWKYRASDKYCQKSSIAANFAKLSQ